MRHHYYYIKVEDHIRLEQAEGPREACRLAFGVIYDRDSDKAVYKDLGTRSPKYFSEKKKMELRGPKDWLPIPKTGK